MWQEGRSGVGNEPAAGAIKTPVRKVSQGLPYCVCMRCVALRLCAMRGMEMEEEEEKKEGPGDRWWLPKGGWVYWDPPLPARPAAGGGARSGSAAADEASGCA